MCKHVINQVCRLGDACHCYPPVVDSDWDEEDSVTLPHSYGQSRPLDQIELYD